MPTGSMRMIVPPNGRLTQRLVERAYMAGPDQIPWPCRTRLHAGELVPGIVSPKGLTFHIRDSVTVGHAERIGHGVDIMHEDAPSELMKELVRRNVMIEICLSSNNLILGISGPQHPLAAYMKHGVPVALATDDLYVAVCVVRLGYASNAFGFAYDAKAGRMLARGSAIAGGSLWSDARRFVPVPQCSQDVVAMKLTSTACRQYQDNNAKAKLQWNLEEEFWDFERQH